MWHAITNSSAVPDDRDLRLAVIKDGEVHALVFACRKTENGWADAASGRPVDVSPTHWQPWEDDRHGLSTNLDRLNTL